MKWRVSTLAELCAAQRKFSTKKSQKFYFFCNFHPDRTWLPLVIAFIALTCCCLIVRGCSEKGKWRESQLGSNAHVVLQVDDGQMWAKLSARRQSPLYWCSDPKLQLWGRQLVIQRKATALGPCGLNISKIVCLFRDPQRQKTNIKTYFKSEQEWVTTWCCQKLRSFFSQWGRRPYYGRRPPPLFKPNMHQERRSQRRQIS